MYNKYNHHISHMENMRRHFSENFYKRFYAILRKAYKLGGLDAVRSVMLCTANEKHGFTEIGRNRALKAYTSLIRNYEFYLIDLRLWTKRSL